MANVLLWRRQLFRCIFFAFTYAAALSSASFAFAAGNSKDIGDTAVYAGLFNERVSAVQTTGLVNSRKGEGSFTVFAPTDDAIAAFHKSTFETRLKPENKDRLVSILSYHDIDRKVMGGDLSNNLISATFQRGALEIKASVGVTVNGANITAANIETSNNVIHVINAVILPS